MPVDEIAKRLEGQPVEFLEFCIKFMRTTDIDEFQKLLNEYYKGDFVKWL